MPIDFQSVGFFICKIFFKKIQRRCAVLDFKCPSNSSRGEKPRCTLTTECTVSGPVVCDDSPSRCADQCGYIKTGICPKYAGCVNGVQWFRDRGQWADNSIEPSPGMIIFFDWDNPNGSSGPQDGESDHAGIVERVENGIVYTVEGNSGDSCRENHYPVGYYEILGYGILNP
ncbi:MAG: CHAP domain-containing protein [Prevotellaceae bacterium]|nr:CHAP domain-containing protein [Candidatus Scatonaster coprocaballi]MBQ0089722.1 CHAP domain-containing protein [Candidatus Faecinaster equi]